MLSPHLVRRAVAVAGEIEHLTAVQLQVARRPPNVVNRAARLGKGAPAAVVRCSRRSGEARNRTSPRLVTSRRTGSWRSRASL